MKLTPEQLHIQKRADYTRGFGLLFYWEDKEQHGYYCSQNTRYFPGLDRFQSGYFNHKVVGLGRPMNWGRLCYLHKIHKDDWTFEHLQRREDLLAEVSDNGEIYQQTVLERSPEFQKLVIAFLESLPDNTAE